MKEAGRNTPTYLEKSICILLIAALSAYILTLFLVPTSRHGGINDYYRSRFIEMVEGTAYKPFVFRTLLPSTVRLIVAITPTTVQCSFSDFVETHVPTRGIFARLGWEVHKAYTYLIASVLMHLSYIAFAHYTAKLVIFTSEVIKYQYSTHLILTTLALLGLPLFFRHASYIYDPPQLFLFTLSLYLLARRRMLLFIGSFALTVINKETAILLIPICALVCRKQYSRREYFRLLFALVDIFIILRISIAGAFRDNPGSFFEFHLWDHNVWYLTQGWSLSTLIVLLILLGLVSYKWKEKPRFLKVGLLCTILPLVCFALFFGFLNEWRDYYEAYPLALGLVADSMFRIKNQILRKAKTRRSARSP